MSEQAFPDRYLQVLEPGRAERHYWRDPWAYRELSAILAWRDVAMRYKQTVIGVAWAVVRPFLAIAVFTPEFGPLRLYCQRPGLAGLFPIRPTKTGGLG